MTVELPDPSIAADRANSIAIRTSATVVISTRNRQDDLRVAMASCCGQLPGCEVLVINDGSTDQTLQMLQTCFPTVRVETHDVSTGYIKARNEGAAAASGDIIFSIDDDAAFTSRHIVEQVLAEFNDPRVGAVAIPYADVNRDGIERQRTPDPSQIWVTDRFIGTAHAIRRDVFLKLGGYRELFFHQGEESDFCIRMLDAGYVVRLGNSDRIDHFESPKRDTKRMDLYGRRNDVLFAVLNVPWSWLPLHLASVTVRGLLFGFKVGRPLRMLQGLLMGYGDAFRYRSHRRAVSVKTYLTFRRLRKKQAIEMSDLMTW
jgi:glycosyltransferase involved in cell wall biosynthesis